jgi:hypothetical protein
MQPALQYRAVLGASQSLRPIRLAALLRLPSKGLGSRSIISKHILMSYTAATQRSALTHWQKFAAMKTSSVGRRMRAKGTSRYVRWVHSQRAL